MLSAMLGLLSLQFLLGIVANLYVTFPESTDKATLWHAAWSHWSTAAHAILGVLIVLLGLVVLIKAIRLRQGNFSALAIIGFIMLLVAAFGGEEFVSTQKDAYSLVMAIGFIVAMGIYGRLLAAVLMAQVREP